MYVTESSSEKGDGENDTNIIENPYECFDLIVENQDSHDNIENTHDNEIEHENENENEHENENENEGENEDDNNNQNFRHNYSYYNEIQDEEDFPSNGVEGEVKYVKENSTDIDRISGKSNGEKSLKKDDEEKEEDRNDIVLKNEINQNDRKNRSISATCEPDEYYYNDNDDYDNGNDDDKYYNLNKTSVNATIQNNQKIPNISNSDSMINNNFVALPTSQNSSSSPGKLGKTPSGTFICVSELCVDEIDNTGMQNHDINNDDIINDYTYNKNNNNNNNKDDNNDSIDNKNNNIIDDSNPSNENSNNPPYNIADNKYI